MNMNVNVSDGAWMTQTAQGWMPGTRQTRISFYDREVQNLKRTEEEGRPIFDMVVFIKKVPPGDKLLEIDRKASKRDFMQYPQEYELYKKHATTPVVGTPLTAWPVMTRAQVAELHAMNILTVEDLANLPDGYGQKMMGFQNWKQKAQSFLQAAKGQGEFERLQAELSKRDEEIARMKANENASAELMRSMQARLEAIEAEQQAAKSDGKARKASVAI
ncbi:MAG: hypothetical protein NUV51_03900 [Sulfuricaulis sp.]|nr:hypothetical protein [Sulfuricaulis sp.]